jgi:tetratricopeptide (TPR) repeat protein
LRTNPGVLLLLGDAYYLTGNYRQASGLYSTIRKMNYSEGFVETSALRKQCIADSISHSIFRTLYYGGLNDSAKLIIVRQAQTLNRRSAALRYFVLLLINGQSHQAAEEMLTAAHSVSTGDLQYFAFIRTADELFARNRFEEAKGILWQAKNIAPTSTMSEQLDERIELCDFVALELL